MYMLPGKVLRELRSILLSGLGEFLYELLHDSPHLNAFIVIGLVIRHVPVGIAGHVPGSL